MIGKVENPYPTLLSVMQELVVDGQSFAAACIVASAGLSYHPPREGEPVAGAYQPDDEVAFALTRLGRNDDDENDYFGALESVKRSQPISRRPRPLDRE